LNTGGSVFLGNTVAAFEDQNNRYNTGIGSSVFQSIVSGTGNTALGAIASQLATANYNTMAGYFAMGSAYTNGIFNTGLGQSVLNYTTTGSYNTALGAQSIWENTTGNYNVGVGVNVLSSSTTGNENTGIGYYAERYNTTGNYNTGIGASALTVNTTGHNNVAIGNDANVTINNLSNATAIGYSAQVAQSNSLVLGGTGANAVKAGIGATTPLSTLDITGTTGTVVKSDQVAGTNNPDNTASIWHYTSGMGSITLPAAASYTNRIYIIVNQTGATCNISSYNDLAGTAQTTLATGASIMIVSNGVNWLRIR
jgi:hypothetical protein